MICRMVIVTQLRGWSNGQSDCETGAGEPEENSCLTRKIHGENCNDGFCPMSMWVE